MICLSSPIVLKYRLIKYRNELLGHPVTGNKEMSKCIEIECKYHAHFTSRAARDID